MDDSFRSRPSCPPRCGEEGRRSIPSSSRIAAQVSDGANGCVFLSLSLSSSAVAEPCLAGPGPFTDAVLSYLLSQYRKSWGSLRGLSSDGWRFRASEDAPELLSGGKAGEEKKERWGDVKVLSITGFSPGVGCVLPFHFLALLRELTLLLPQTYGQSRSFAQGKPNLPLTFSTPPPYFTQFPSCASSPAPSSICHPEY
jgi:hypothetical protein